jgi:hypothetical protein
VTTQRRAVESLEHAEAWRGEIRTIGAEGVLLVGSTTPSIETNASRPDVGTAAHPPNLYGRSVVHVIWTKIPILLRVPFGGELWVLRLEYLTRTETPGARGASSAVIAVQSIARPVVFSSISNSMEKSTGL